MMTRPSSSSLELINNLKIIDHITIGIGSENIVPIEHVRNLGFFMDKLCKTYYAYQQTFLFIVSSA